MTMPITCDVFEARLADWLEDALSADERAALEAHEAACAACGTLAGELREIRAAAAALPELPPSRDLWSGIAERIEPAVVPLDAARTMERRTAHRARRWGLAAAAAALVIASSGIGYGVAMRRAESRYQAALAERGSAGSAAPAVSAAPSRDSMSAAPALLAERAEAGAEERAAGERTAASGGASRAGGRPAEARFARGNRSSPAVVTYDREIERLHALVERRRGELDSATVAVIERNLRVIDEAIAQSRDALARDPRSSFLHEQLNDALDHKVQLLRTAALLPART